MAVESTITTPVQFGNCRTQETVDLAYILAASYSGSTLLAMLLGSQPEACTVGEMRAPRLAEPDSYLCSCGEPIRQCRFWTDVSKRMASRGIADFDITRAHLSIHDTSNNYLHRVLKPLPRGPLLETARSAALLISPAWKNHLRSVQFRNVALVEVLREITGAKTIVDSSKIALHLRYLLRTSGLKIKTIWLIRDGRAVATSMLGHGTKNMEEAALSWRRNNEAAERVLQDLPDSQWMRVRYEELCRQPEAILRGICSFLGMNTREIALDFRSHEQHVLGNDMRLKSTSDIRVDERWRTDLSQADLKTFDQVAGDLNRKYGYE